MLIETKFLFQVRNQLIKSSDYALHALQQHPENDVLWPPAGELSALFYFTDSKMPFNDYLPLLKFPGRLKN